MTVYPNPPAPRKWRRDKPPVLTGQKCRDRENLRYERTCLLPRERAARFLDALAALPHVTYAALVRDHHVTGDAPRWFVRFKRDEALRPAKAASAMQDTRVQRAADQAGEMAFYPSLDKPGWSWCVHTYPDQPDADAGVYEVHPALGCTCPDHEYRCDAMALLCKHQLALAATQPGAAPPPLHGRRDRTIEEARALRERVLANIARDFGG